MAPIPKWLRPHAKKTELTKDVKPRLAIIESVMMHTAPVYNWKRWVKWMTLLDACQKEWISDVTFRKWRYEDKKIWDYIEWMKAARKEMLHTMMEQTALDNVMEWINWGVKLRPMDKINISLRYLEKTSAEFNPAIKVDVDNVTNPLLSMNKQEMEQRIMELSSKLNLKTNIITNDNNNEWALQLSYATSTSDSQESVWDGENESNG